MSNVFLNDTRAAELWAAVKECALSSGVPAGAIVIWSGTAETVPDGWALCNGENGTPDLRDRFVLGAGGTRETGEVGGEEAVALTVEQIPSHSHSLTVYEQLDGSPVSASSYGKTTQGALKATLTTTKIGGSLAHDNMPPYFALCYIMKL